MIRNLVRRGLAGLLFLSLLASSQPAEAAGIPAARRLPAEVVLYLTAPDITDLKQRFGQSSFGRMINDPALADFSGDVKKALAAASASFQANAGISIDRLLAVPSGEVSLAFFVSLERAPGWVVMLDFGTNRSTIDTLLTKISDGLTQSGAKKTRVESGGASITNFNLPKAPAADPNLETGPKTPASLTRLGWFIKDTTLVLGNGTQTLRAVLARWDGKHTSTFADNPVYRYIAKKGAGDGARPVMEWYFNPIAAVQGLMTAVDPNNFQAQLALGFLPTLGLDKIKALGGTMNIMTPKFESISRTVLYVEPPRNGALDLLKFPAIAQAPPKWVPANAVSYSSLNWDLKATWRGIATLVDSFNPQGPGTFDRLVDDLAQQPGGPMIHPKKDLFDHLSGRIQIVTDATEAAVGGLSSSRFLVALGAKNADGLKATFNKLVNSPGSPLETRQFRGETIYEIPFPAELAATGLSSLGLSITQGNLMISSHVTMIEQAIRADVDPLSGSSDYKRMASAFPAKTSMVFYAKQNSQLKTIYDLVRSGNFPPASPGAGFPGADPAAIAIDFTKLPPFTVIEKYLRGSGGYVLPDENGAVIVSFSLRDKTP